MVEQLPRSGLVQVEILGEGVPYLDGSEDYLLGVMRTANDRSAGSDELARHIRDWPTRYHLVASRPNLLMPLELGPDLDVLDVGAGTGALARAMAEAGSRVVALEGSRARAEVAAARLSGMAGARVLVGSLEDYERNRPSDAPDGFDVIVACGVLEYSGAGVGGQGGPGRMLRSLSALLKPAGRLLLAIENKWGLKYLLSHPEDHLGLPWVGLEGYRRDSSGIRTWSQRELRRLLESAGLPDQDWFAAYPDYKTPSTLVHESMFDTEEGRTLVKQFVRTPTTDPAAAQFTVDQMAAFQSAVDAGLGMPLANSFVVLAGHGTDGRGLHRSGSMFLGVPERAAAWRQRRVLSKREGGWTLVSERGNNIEISWPLRNETHEEVDVVPGHNAEDLITFELMGAGIGSARLAELLNDWRSAAASSVSGSEKGGFHFDVMPSNFIVDEAGRWHYIDPEWTWMESVDFPLIALRCMIWTSARITQRTAHIRGIPDGTSTGSLALTLCELAGVTPGTESIDRFIEFESVVQAKVAGRDDEEGREQMRGLLAATVATPLSASRGSMNVLSILMENRALHEELGASRQGLEAERTRVGEAEAAAVGMMDELALARAEIGVLRTQTEQLGSQLDLIFRSKRWKLAEALRKPLRH